MKRFLTIFVLALVFSSTQAKAQGVPVIDGQSLIQKIMGVLKQIDEYNQQILQYREQLNDLELQAKNTLAPYAYVWDQTQKTMDKVLALQNEMDYIKSRYGDVQAYLEQYKTVDFYRSNQYFGEDGVSRYQEDRLKEKEISLNAQDSANDHLTKAIDDLNTDLTDLIKPGGALDKTHGGATSAEGQMQAIQATNSFLDLQSKQLVQMQTLLLAQAKVVSEEANARRLDQETRKLHTDEFKNTTYAPFEEYPAPKFGR